jgi:NADH:ubiquinone oxidoreductase subunit F (NADH-binding)
VVSDDIVTRLRIACREEGAEYCGKCQPCEAADEIERLRAELEESQMTVRALHKLIGERQ